MSPILTRNRLFKGQSVVVWQEMPELQEWHPRDRGLEKI